MCPSIEGGGGRKEKVPAGNNQETYQVFVRDDKGEWTVVSPGKQTIDPLDTPISEIIPQSIDSRSSSPE